MAKVTIKGTAKNISKVLAGPFYIHTLDNNKKMLILVDPKKRVERVEDLLPKKKLVIPDLPKPEAKAGTTANGAAQAAPAPASVAVPAAKEKKARKKSS